MTQTSALALNEFVLSVLSGKVEIPSAGKADGKIIEYVNKLDSKKVEAIAAEAINQDIVSSDVSWDALVNQINGIIEKSKP